MPAADGAFVPLAELLQAGTLGARQARDTWPERGETARAQRTPATTPSADRTERVLQAASDAEPELVADARVDPADRPVCAAEPASEVIDTKVSPLSLGFDRRMGEALPAVGSGRDDDSLPAPDPGSGIRTRGVPKSAREPVLMAAHELGSEPANDSAELRAALRDARLFRAALADIFELQASELVRELARAVLARELQIAPPDLAAIASHLIARFLADEPVRLRVAPEAAEVSCAVPVVADPQLALGDAVLECRYGTIDARIGVRLASVLGHLAP